MLPETYGFTEQGIEQALTALGTTPNAVATNLSAMGFRGCRDAESNCPVANYLLDSVPDIAYVSVYGETFRDNGRLSKSGHVEAIGPDAVEEVVNLPFAVAQFVIAFDLGDYPDLIEGRRHGA